MGPPLTVVAVVPPVVGAVAAVLQALSRQPLRPRPRLLRLRRRGFAPELFFGGRSEETGR